MIKSTSLLIRFVTVLIGFVVLGTSFALKVQTLKTDPNSTIYPIQITSPTGLIVNNTYALPQLSTIKNVKALGFDVSSNQMRFYDVIPYEIWLGYFDQSSTTLDTTQPIASGTFSLGTGQTCVNNYKSIFNSSLIDSVVQACGNFGSGANHYSAVNSNLTHCGQTENFRAVRLLCNVSAGNIDAISGRVCFKPLTNAADGQQYQFSKVELVDNGAPQTFTSATITNDVTTNQTATAISICEPKLLGVTQQIK